MVYLKKEIAQVKKSKRENLFFKLYQSVFTGSIIRILEYLYKLMGGCLTLKLMSSYEKIDGYLGEKYKSSHTAHVFCKFSEIWERIAKEVSESFFLKFFTHLAKLLLNTRLQVYGAGFLAFGISAFTVVLISKENFEIAVFLLFVILMSLIMFTDKTAVKKLLFESVATGFVLKKVIGVSLRGDSDSAKGMNLFVSSLTGVLLGTLTFFISPISIFRYTAVIIFVIFTFSLPDRAIVLLSFVLPFLCVESVCIGVIFILAAFLIKTFTGKYKISFELLDALVLVLFVFICEGVIFSANFKSSVVSASTFLCLGSLYFLVKNLIKDIADIKRIANGFVFSALLASLYGIYQNFSTNITAWHDTSMFSYISTRVYSVFSNPNVFGEYLILTFPFILTAFFMKKRFYAAMATLVAFTALVFTWSRGAWLGFAVSIILITVLFGEKTMTASFFGIVSFLPIAHLFADTVFHRFTSIGNIADSSTFYRVNIWRGTVEMIKKFFFSGVGTGIGAFEKMYPEFAPRVAPISPHSHNLFLQIISELGIFGFLVFIAVIVIFMQKAFTYILHTADRTSEVFTAACVCAVTALTVQGLGDYVWYDYRIFSLFFMIMGMCSVCTDRNISSEKRKE